MKIGVVGLGKLGLPLALVFAKAGFEIKGVDAVKERVLGITDNKKMSEPKVNDYWLKYQDKIEMGIRYYQLLRECPVVFVVVQTPSLANHVFDTQYVEAAVKSIHRVNSDCLIVISSTVPPKTCDALTKIHARIAYNPEFIKQGSIIDDFENPKFVLVGAYSKDEAGVVMNIWRKVSWMKVYWLKPLEAEIAKLAINVAQCKDITFANVMGEFCESMGANSKSVMDVVNLDRRNYQAGLGYGGVCFPRDTKCFRALEKGYGFQFIDALETLNQDTILKYSYQLEESKGDIAFIGLAYKRGVPILEESQSYKILLDLLKEASMGKRKIYVWDESGVQVFHQLKNIAVRCCRSLDAAIRCGDTIFFGLPIKAPPKLLRGKRVIDPWGLNQ